MSANGWKSAVIGDLCTFSSGNGFGRADWAKAGLPIIRIQHLNGSDNFDYFAGTPDPEWIVEPGELLFAWAGTQGVSFGPKLWSGPRGVLNQHIYRVRPRSGVDPAWLHFLLQVITIEIERKAHGFKSNLVHVRKADITNRPCQVPPLTEQRAIADVINLWGRGVEQAERLLKFKRRLKRGLMQQLLTGRRRFSEPAGQLASGQEIPADWSLVALSDIARKLTRKNTAAVEHVLTISGKRGFVDQREYFDRRIAAESVEGYYHIKRGEFAYNRSLMNGYPFGAIKRLDQFEEGVVSTLYICFSLTDAQACSDYFAHLFESGYLNRQLSRITNLGSRAHGLLNVTATDFMKVRVPLPPPEEQKKIAAVLLAADRELALLEEQLAAFRKQKKGLMQKLLTGKVRVPELHETSVESALPKSLRRRA